MSDKDAELIALLHAKIDELGRGDAGIVLKFIHAFGQVIELEGRIGADVVSASIAFLKGSKNTLPRD